jgi:effector-binding domain-containing protein
MTEPMIDAPQIIETTPQYYAGIHIVVPRDEIQNVMGPTIGEVFQAISAQGVAPVGPWFTHHFRRPTETFDFEVCVPVAAPITAAGRVQPGEWPAMKVARTVHQGSYEELGEAWGEFLDWIETNGYKTADELWERYLVGPETDSDPAAWRTQLNRPLVD